MENNSNIQVINELKLKMSEDKFEEILQILSKLEGTSMINDTELLEYKVKSLANLGRIKEALQLSQSLPKDSASRKIVENFLRMLQNTNLYPQGQAIIKGLEDFADQNGILRNKVSIVYIDKDYRGVVANSKIHKGEIIFSVPEKAMIYDEIARESKIGKKIEEKLITYMKDNKIEYPYIYFITLFFLQEMQIPNSFWKLYIDCFPKEIPTFPIMFTKYEQELCKGTLIFKNYTKDLNDYQKIYNFIIQNAPEFSYISLSEFVKMISILTSRWLAFYNKEGLTYESCPVALTPFIDMANYHPELSKKTKTFFDLKNRVMRFEAVQDFELGEEIFNNYHSLDPESNLFYYGFTANDFKSIGKELRVLLNKSEPFYQDKLKLLSINFKKIFNGKDNVTIEFRKGDINECNKIFFQVLRLLLYDQPFDLFYKKYSSLKLDSEFEFSKYPIFFISIENEVNVFNWIIDSTKKELEEFHPFWSTSYEKDKLSINERNIEYIVRLEKELCSELIVMASSGIEFIQSNFTQGPKYCGEFSYFYEGLLENIKSSK